MAQNTEVLTIMLVDLGNYTKTTSSLSRESFEELHEVFDSLVEESVFSHKGHIIKKIGDAFLITFKAATDAVHCGVSMQKAFAEHNHQNPSKQKLRIRVAIHMGEILLRKGDVYGEAVNITARIESIAKVGDVVFSEAVYSAMNKSEINYKYIGKFKLKGVKLPARLFKVKTSLDVKKERIELMRKRFRELKRNSVKVIIMLGGLAILIAIIYLLLTS
jgi:class 3 adenylate cyclase